MFTISLLFVYTSLIFYLLTIGLLYFNASSLKTPVCNHKNVWRFFVMLAVIYVYGAFGGDYPHYGQIVSNIYRHSRYLSHFEDIYIDLAKYVEGDYVLFRVIIAITSFVSLYWIFKLTNRVDYRILFLYSIFEFMHAVEGRQQCSIYMFFLGLFILMTVRKRVLILVLGLCLLILSSFLHKSGYLNYAVLAFLLFKFSKRNIIISLLLFPLVVKLENDVLSMILKSSDTDFAGAGYLTADDFSRTFVMQFIFTTRIIIQYLIAFWILSKVRTKYNLNQASNLDLVNAKMLYGAMYISSALFFLDIDQLTLFDRSLRLWWIPSLILIGSIIKPQLTKNKFIFNLTLIYLFVSVMYILVAIRYQPKFYV